MTRPLPSQTLPRSPELAPERRCRHRRQTFATFQGQRGGFARQSMEWERRLTAAVPAASGSAASALRQKLPE